MLADFQSSSPPRKDTTIYTPSSAQKRFNPFMKDTMGKNVDDSYEPTLHKSNTSPTHKKPLTPTKDHPLMDLERKKPPKGEFMDDSDEAEDDVIVMQSVDRKADDVGSDDSIINDINQIPPELDTHQVTTVVTSNSDDDTNNNTDHQAIEGVDELFPEKVAKRQTSPSRNSSSNNNSVNLKNNNRVSPSITRDRSQSRIEDGLSNANEKIDGKLSLKAKKNKSFN